MKINFLDDTTIEVTESLEWTGKRPKNKIQLRQGDIVKEFYDKHSDLLVEKISGPARISNFRSKEESKGVWTLKVKDKKALAKKASAPAKKGAPTVKKTSKVKYTKSGKEG